MKLDYTVVSVAVILIIIKTPREIILHCRQCGTDLYTNENPCEINYTVVGVAVILIDSY